ncbi:MAG: hypothetical protein A2Y12_06840 [Planctomycetes bacterium GWF2_42_9]|nr:MAG: hypothetical protein A2Y12_06840 [Planctomycetes bacterium GWF2_42_9]
MNEMKLIIYGIYSQLILSTCVFGVINVKDYSAKGDGITDDTNAIQAAFDAQREGTKSTVYFPAGNYLVSDTLKMYMPDVSGESFLNTKIIQQQKDKDIFNGEYAWRGQIRNLTFIGGAKQLNLRNIRTDQGMMCVEQCSFTDSSDFAIYMAPQSNPMHFIIRECHFGNCAQVLYTVCDWTTFSDCWITTARMENKAAIEARGDKLLCENIIGVPIVTGKNDRWIDFYGSEGGNLLTCKNFRFGGEFGGTTPVYNFTKLDKNMAGGGIVLEDCRISAGGGVKKCAIYCEEIPNMIVIQNCVLHVPALILSPKINLSEYFKNIPEGLLYYDLLGNVSLSRNNAQAISLMDAAKSRDTSPEAIAGQLDSQQTQIALKKIITKIEQLEDQLPADTQFNGHKMKTDKFEYIDINLNTHIWDMNVLMSPTVHSNNEYMEMAQLGDDIVFMRRAPGLWPSVIVRDVEVDVEKTPFISWRQKDPGNNPLPNEYKLRNETNKLDPNIIMPSGYAIRVFNHQSQESVLLHEIHTPPWYDYRAYDLRKALSINKGKVLIDIIYYPLGVYITGRPGSGHAIPPEYQIIDFIRLESE